MVNRTSLKTRREWEKEDRIGTTANGTYSTNGTYPTNGTHPINGAHPTNGTYPTIGAYPTNGTHPTNGAYPWSAVTYISRNGGMVNLVLLTHKC